MHLHLCGDRFGVEIEQPLKAFKRGTKFIVPAFDSTAGTPESHVLDNGPVLLRTSVTHEHMTNISEAPRYPNNVITYLHGNYNIFSRSCYKLLLKCQTANNWSSVLRWIKLDNYNSILSSVFFTKLLIQQMQRTADLELFLYADWSPHCWFSLLYKSVSCVSSSLVLNIHVRNVSIDFCQPQDSSLTGVSKG